MDRLSADITQAFAQVAHPVAALPVQGNVFQCVEASGIERGQAQAGIARLTQVEVAQRCQDGLQTSVRKCDLQAATYFALVGGNLYQQAFVVAALVQLGRI
ncbi:hypothetical protein D3C77_661060 [compost metagenome]